MISSDSSWILCKGENHIASSSYLPLKLETFWPCWNHQRIVNKTTGPTAAAYESQHQHQTLQPFSCLGFPTEDASPRRVANPSSVPMATQPLPGLAYKKTSNFQSSNSAARGKDGGPICVKILQNGGVLARMSSKTVKPVTKQKYVYI